LTDWRGGEWCTHASRRLRRCNRVSAKGHDWFPRRTLAAQLRRRYCRFLATGAACWGLINGAGRLQPVGVFKEWAANRGTIWPCGAVRRHWSIPVKRYLTDGVSIALGALWAWTSAAGPASAQTPNVDVYELSIEDLMNSEVTSVSLRPEPLARAPAAIDVITAEAIQRSGAQSLPEILRLARNLEVAQIDAQRYAISARGFNSYEASNKLLVLIDGRSVYTPLYSGVFWDQQHVLLDDIERIEVVSGPGGTLWGANAVNGVINIITKAASDSQGFFAEAFAGSNDSRIDARYGGGFGANGRFRVFASGYALGPTLTLAGDDANDDWGGAHGGFRADWGGADDRFMLQGSLFADELDAGGSREGAHVQGRWRRQFGDGSSVQVQSYYSSEEREAALRATPGTFDSSATWDISLQHNIQLGPAHQLVWGAGYRLVDSEFINTINPAAFEEPRRQLETANVFIQDEIALRADLALTLGLKFEEHDFTGLEYMPNVRMAWRPSEDFMIWSAISRAVRTPSRIDQELTFVGFPGFITTFTFESEELLAYELGLRFQPTASTTFSATLYRHEYDKLRTSTLSPPAPGGFPVYVGNGLEGEVYGLELWGDVALSEAWRVSAGLTVLEQEFRADPLSSDVNASGDDPGYQVFLRSQANLSPDLMFDLHLRAIAEPSPAVPAYVELDARLGWRLSERVEVALAGRNLLDEAHPEAFDIAPLLQARRNVQMSLRVTY
jgi:iron complex outermembrane recepter protein